MTSTTLVFAGGLAALSVLAMRAAGPQQERPAPAQPVQSAVCVDSQGGEYSPGAVVTVDGKSWECIGPGWAPAGAGASGDDLDVLEVGNANMAADIEAVIQAALSRSSLPPLQCDAVLNTEAGAAQLLHLAHGERRLVLFWTPTCGPCKPVMADMAALAARRPTGLAFLGVVQAIEPDLEPAGDWPLVRVKGLIARYDVHFPTCVHSSREQTKLWRAQGVPLILVVSEKGVERVALGGRNGQRLVAELAGQH